MNGITNAIAAAGIATWFTPEIRELTMAISDNAALFMPILGCLWLGVQTITHIHNHFRKKGKPE